jgi:hypothetical protein
MHIEDTLLLPIAEIERDRVLASVAPREFVRP